MILYGNKTIVTISVSCLTKFFSLAHVFVGDQYIYTYRMILLYTRIHSRPKAMAQMITSKRSFYMISVNVRVLPQCRTIYRTYVKCVDCCCRSMCIMHIVLCSESTLYTYNELLCIRYYLVSHISVTRAAIVVHRYQDQEEPTQLRYTHTTLI